MEANSCWRRGAAPIRRPETARIRRPRCAALRGRRAVEISSIALAPWILVKRGYRNTPTWSSTDDTPRTTPRCCPPQPPLRSGPLERVLGARDATETPSGRTSRREATRLHPRMTRGPPHGGTTLTGSNWRVRPSRTSARPGTPACEFLRDCPGRVPGTCLSPRDVRRGSAARPCGPESACEWDLYEGRAGSASRGLALSRRSSIGVR